MKIIFLISIQIALCLTLFAQAKQLPYYSGFDTPAEKEGWTEYRTGDLSSFSWNITGSISNDYNVGGNATDTVIDWLVSPPIYFHTTAFASMKVSTYGFNSPTPDNCEVYFGTGNQDPEKGDFKLVANLSYMGPQFQWNDTTFVIPFTADSGYLAFKYKTIGGAWMTYTIDSISLNATVGQTELNLNEDLEVEIFPNPFQNQTLVKFNKTLQNATATLIDIYGKPVFQQINISGNSFNLKSQNLSSGIYFLKVVESEKFSATSTIKIL